VTSNACPAEGEPIVYQVRLSLSVGTVRLVSQAIRQYRVEVRSRWRVLSDLQCAVIVLAVLRHDQRPEDLGAAYGVSGQSVRRWVDQAVGVLARQAPRLDRALTRASRDGTQTLLLDGCCIPVQQPAGRRNAERHYCAKHKARHLRVLTLTDQHGRLRWISAAQPARTHETTQAKRHEIPRRLRELNTAGADLGLICDRAHTRLDDQPDTNPTVITGRRANRYYKLTPADRQANQLLNAERAPNEHAHAHLKNWRILTRLRHGWVGPRATTLLRALLVLTNTEIRR
jgi:hypothetical protein